MELVSQPFKGGMNSDDNLDNMPINDYEIGKNLYAEFGNEYLQKLKGINDELGISIGSGESNFLGAFQILEDQYIIVADPSAPSHIIYKMERKFVGVNSFAEMVFAGELDFSTTRLITDFLLVDNNIIILNNGVDEIQKIYLSAFGFYGSGFTPSFNFENYPSFTIGTDGEYLTFLLVDDEERAWSNPEDNFTSIFVAGFDGMDADDLKTLSPLINFNVRGTRISEFVFKTGIRVEGNVPYLGNTFYGIPNIYFGQIADNSIEFGYRGHPNEHYLINIPHRDRPQVSFVTQEDKKKNNVSDDSFSFQIQYIYNDDTKSAWSPKSDILLPEKKNSLNFFKNNGILVVAKNPLYYEAYQVKTIVFGVIKNEGILYEFDRVDVVRPISAIDSLQGDISVIYSNDSILKAIPDNERLSLYDYIFPNTSSIELFDKSTIGFSGIEPLIDSTKSNIDAEVVKTPLTFETASDYCHTFHYDLPYKTPLTVPPILEAVAKKINKTYTYRTADDVFQVVVENRNFRGEVLTAAGAEAVQVSNSGLSIRRYSEARSDKSFGFLEFSPLQTIGTEYEITISGDAAHPKKGTFAGNIFTFTATFTAKTTDSQDLINDIKSWYNGMANVSFGNPGDYVEFSAFDQDSGLQWFSTYDVPVTVGFKGIVFSAGLQCIHSEPGHYHWHQVKNFKIEVSKTNYINRNRRTLKGDASHPIAIQHYDKFNRIINNDKIGALNVDSFIGDAVENLYDKVKLRIDSTPPVNAVRASLLYAGNSDNKNVTYVIAGAITDNGDTLSFPITFDSFNAKNQANLSYSFTEGDIISRRKEVSGPSYLNLTGEDTIPLKVIGEDAGVLTVQKNADNLIVVGDLLEIITPALDISEEDLLYYEVGDSIPIENGNYVGDISKGSTAFGDIEISTVDISEATGEFAGKTVLDVDTNYSLSQYLAFLTLENNYVEIFAPSISGKYDILRNEINFTGDNIFTINLEFSQIPAGTYNILLYFGGDRLVASTTSQTYGYSEVVIENMGDAYLRYRDDIYQTTIESFQKNDTVTNKEWAKGRPAILLDNSYENTDAIIRHSQPFIDNSTINGISTVFASNFYEYDSTFGVIKKLAYLDGKLYMFRNDNVTYALVNRSIVDQADGSQLQTLGGILSETEQFLNGLGGIGSLIHSVLVRSSGIYFASDIRKTINRIEGNNIIQISKIKMNNYFNDLLKNEGVVRITYNEDDSYLIVHFKNETINKQVIFSEKELFEENENRWISEWELDAEYVGFLGEVISVATYTANLPGPTLLRSLFVHSNKADRNNAYGVQLESLLQKTFSSPRMKRFKTMMLDPLFIDKQLDITNDEGQASNLLIEDFVRDGAGHWAAFYFDTNTPDLANALLNGDDLQSKNITLALKSDTNKDEGLGTIAVNYEDVE